MKVYQSIASKINAMNNCIDTGNDEWLEKHKEKIEWIMSNAPSGSGIDCGTKIDLEKSTEDKLVFYTSYHHVNEDGMYDGWTEHVVKVIPSLALGFDLKITGRDRNMIKDYLHEVYHTWLSTNVDA